VSSPLNPNPNYARSSWPTPRVLGRHTSYGCTKRAVRGDSSSTSYHTSLTRSLRWRQSSVAADGTGVAVDVATLDDVLVNERHIVALKIDVEGAGASVVRGARRVFSECKIDHLFMEDTQTAQALTETDAFHLGRFHKLIAFREVYEAENDIVQSEFHNNMTALYEVVRSGDVRGDEYFEDFTHRPIQTKTAMWQDFWLRGDDDVRIDHQRPWLLQQE